MPEELEKPEGARRADSRLLVVDHYRTRGVDATRGEQVGDDPEERRQRRRVGVDQAQTEEIEMGGARDVTGRERLSRPQIQQDRGLAGSPGA